ncbi:MAG: prepilin-type N-terminal cleavage/methylation domain-containing protein [Candidatus Shapirobacteria bacterium]|jgi:prepilin-type N-terminal cleavage/methylation domain-containing protein
MTNKAKLSKEKNQGFTLVELLVTVTIIAVITVVAMVSYGGTVAKSRDSRRMSDLEKIRIAAEMAKQTGVTYPATVGGMQTGGYLQQIPLDPGSYDYYYLRGAANLFTYELCAHIENVGSTNCSGGCGNCGNNCGGACNYRLTNP